MFGYATNETRALMPMPIQIAHTLARRLAEVRKSGELDYLRPDGKTQVTVRYRDGVPVAIEKILISTQHAEGVDNESGSSPTSGSTWSSRCSAASSPTSSTPRPSRTSSSSTRPASS